MRLWGLILLVGGGYGFYYASTRLSGAPPVPAGVGLADYLRYDAGKWELARYGSALAGFLGILLSLFPRGP